MSQFSVPGVVYRGGTSRGLFFHKKDLPKDEIQQRRVFLAGIDAWNPSQIDGLGSGTSHTSKVVVISPPSVEGADVDYTFYQIGIGRNVVDDKGTCGNLMAAVGPFAVDEGLVKPSPSDRTVELSAFNTNIGKMIRLQVPVVNGAAKVTGEYAVSGLVKTGAKIVVEILSPGGGKTGKTLPAGAKQVVATNRKSYEASIADVVNPCVFVSAADLGLQGTELNSELADRTDILQELESIRLKMAVAAGMAQNEQEAEQTPSIPKIAMVTEPQDYVTSAGKLIKASEVDIVARMVSMGRFHRTFAGSCLYNLAATCLLSGTIPNRFSAHKYGGKEAMIRIGHPEGIVEVRAGLTEDRKDIAFVGLDRTARRIMKGEIFVPVQG